MPNFKKMFHIKNDEKDKSNNNNHLHKDLNFNKFKDNDIFNIKIPLSEQLKKKRNEQSKKETKKINEKTEIEIKNEINLIGEDENKVKKHEHNDIEITRKIIKKRKKNKDKLFKIKKPIYCQIKHIAKSNAPPKKKIYSNKNKNLSSKKKDINIYNINNIEDSKNSIHNLDDSKNKLTRDKNQKQSTKRAIKYNRINKNKNNKNIASNNITIENIEKGLDIRFGSNEFYQYLMLLPEQKRMQFFFDEEINTLEYQNALDIDKRSFLEIYYSFLKKQNILIFCLSYCTHDYNLPIMKFSFLMFQIILFITVSAFFFTDNTLNNIYENKNKFDVPFMLRQLILTYLIILGINIIFKMLVRTDNKIIDIKQENDNVNDGLSSIKCKFIFYFIFGNLILMFGWFYISCFCAVLSHTQVILIKCAIYSLFIEFIFPFFFCLLSSSFRVCSLKSEKKNNKCLYEVSKILSFL